MRNEQKSSVRLSTFLSRTLAWFQPDPSPVESPPVSFQQGGMRPLGVDNPERSQASVEATESEASGEVPESVQHAGVEPPAMATVAEDLPQTPQRKSLLRRPWLVAMLVSGGTGTAALLWLSILPPLPNCQRISPLASDAERLYCADQATRQGDIKYLIAALKTVSDWPQDHPLSLQATHLRNEWSRSLLSVATQKRDQGKLKEAVALARQVPSTSALYSEAQATIQTWQTDWDKGSVIYNQAQAALKAQQWDQVALQLKLLVKLDNDYWRQRIKELNARLATERSAWKQLRQAQRLAQAGTSEALAEAIALVSQVGPQSYVAGPAKVELENWSQRLLEVATERVADEDWQGAIAAAEKIPVDASVHPAAQDIVNFGQAQILSQKDKLWAYVNAWILTEQIPPERPFYEQAQTKTANWEQQIQNLTQIGLAKWFASLGASFGQGFGYQIALDHAALIEADHPRRLRAQTLIAQWRKQLEILEDGHYLARAIQLVGAGTMENLQAAIQQASQVTVGRALRLEAQALIAHWKDKIQSVQDQPLLQEAKALAEQGRFSEAIQSAEKIPSDRALYSEAQAAIRQWVGQIQSAEDQPILDEATTLARQGRLTEAITTAARISSGRSLYYDAQRAIGGWIKERDAVSAEPQAAETDYSDNDSSSDAASPPSEDNLSPDNPRGDEASSSPEVSPPTPESSPTVDDPLVDENFEPIP